MEEDPLKKAFEIAQRKLATLTTDNYLTFRFMSYREFEQIMRMGRAYGGQITQYGMTFDKFVKLAATYYSNQTNERKKEMGSIWSDIAKEITD